MTVSVPTFRVLFDQGLEGNYFAIAALLVLLLLLKGNQCLSVAEAVQGRCNHD